jgi:hypothetical protein
MTLVIALLSPSSKINEGQILQGLYEGITRNAANFIYVFSNVICFYDDRAVNFFRVFSLKERRL